MIPISLKDGPLDNQLAPSTMFSDGEASFRLRQGKLPNIAYVAQGSTLVSPEIFPKVRIAIYRLSDNENAVANFIGWDDEIERDNSLAEAMANASDDEILKLMDEIERTKRKQ